MADKKFMGNKCLGKILWETIARYCIKCGNKRKLDNQEIATESVKKKQN